MSNNSPRILFIGHNASRTGAPLLLLEFLRWLKSRGDIGFELLLFGGGPLVADYREICPTKVLTELVRSLPYRIQSKLRGGRGPMVRALYPQSSFPTIYVNSIAGLDLGLDLAEDGRQLAIHVHELAFAFEMIGGRPLIERAMKLSPSIIAASEAVKDFLMSDLGIGGAHVRLVHEFFVSKMPAASEAVRLRDEFRRQHGISADTCVIGMCGSIEWRKGSDLFPLLARETRARSPRGRYAWVWLGGSAHDQITPNFDVRLAGLEESCRFLPAVSDPSGFFASLDVFCLTSREDPFSVAMLEAASAGAPVVCFEKSGGGPELVAGGAGIAVDYLDLGAMSAACVRLGDDPALRKQMGDMARQKVLNLYTFERHAEKLMEVIHGLHRAVR